MANSYAVLEVFPIPQSSFLSAPKSASLSAISPRVLRSLENMDIDRMKASTRNHIGTLTRAMPHDNFSQGSGPCPYISDSSDLEFSSESAASIESTPAMFRNPYFVASTNSSMSFMGSPLQESTSSPHIASNVVVPKLRNGTELSFSASLQKRSSMETMREMIFRIAMMQPINIDPESLKPPKRKNVKVSKDPQSVAARHRRERISERIRILQRLVPGGTKMDTASMLDEAAHYLKFLKKQVQSLEQAANNRPLNAGIPMTMATAAMSYSNLMKSCQPPQMVGSMQMLS